jgi:predicted enzyme related to lactoylglutathione lyase
VHKSQLAGFIIDCETDDLDEAATFWSAALGIKARGHDGPSYVALDTRPEDYHIEVQKVDHPSRVHLDIETDDIEAEVRRLEALGARRIGPVSTWVVMDARTTG